jgi:enoyl-CoA hydratase
MSLVERSDVGGVATLTLNRPDKLNALTPAVFEELRAHLDALAADETVGCVVLTGAGRSFCAGHDLGAIASNDKSHGKYFESETVDRLEQLPIPTVAAVRGHCLTGGLELALACDLIVATESSSFADTHGVWGLAPIWGMTVRLPERVGKSRAKELMFTARRINGVEAAAIGLVDRCVADDALDSSVATLTAEIVANSWGTNRINKQNIALAATMPRPAALAIERTLPFGRPTDTAERMARRK